MCRQAPTKKGGSPVGLGRESIPGRALRQEPAEHFTVARGLRLPCPCPWACLRTTLPLHRASFLSEQLTLF